MPFPKHFVNNIELYLTTVGVIICFAIPVLFGVHNYWQVLAITAVGISILHGVLFWVVRRRQRRLRQELIEAMRPMLSDRIKNLLTVVLMAATERSEMMDAARVEAAITAADEITATLDQLSLESVRRWHRHYQSGPVFTI
ncbi:MAG TPA: hypothetical protein VNU46_02470 [Gemmatimonadaceae bacterium]|jgi:low affinity Fe/Cu permease|nr:hypothetical protein [Gemmatimonadaceae bacterium]